jgi:hypothetical protein
MYSLWVSFYLYCLEQTTSSAIPEAYMLFLPTLVLERWVLAISCSRRARKGSASPHVRRSSWSLGHYNTGYLERRAFYTERWIKSQQHGVQLGWTTWSTTYRCPTNKTSMPHNIASSTFATNMQPQSSNAHFIYNTISPWPIPGTYSDKIHIGS